MYIVGHERAAERTARGAEAGAGERAGQNSRRNAVARVAVSYLVLNLVRARTALTATLVACQRVRVYCQGNS